jgi:hypothetical protein
LFGVVLKETRLGRFFSRLAVALEAAEKVSYFVIPNEVRNLSGFYSQQKERFLGTQRASE